MRAVSILDDEDQVDKNDWCRPLYIVSMTGGYSDNYSFTSCYTGVPENNAKWIQVKRLFGKRWYGKKVSELNSISEVYQYEFCRGDIPKGHQECYSISEFKRKEFPKILKNSVIPRGKYKGKTWADVQFNSPDYFRWADLNNFAPCLNKHYRKYREEFYEIV